MARMSFVASLLSLPIPFADAPNPADCPHHQCNYHPVTASGWPRCSPMRSRSRWGCG
jgi:hypothetical protein